MAVACSVDGSDQRVIVAILAPGACLQFPVLRLLDQLGETAMVELTVHIGAANMGTSVNTADGVTSQGFSDACEIPLARRPTTSESASPGGGMRSERTRLRKAAELNGAGLHISFESLSLFAHG